MKRGGSPLQHELKVEDVGAFTHQGNFAFYLDMHGARGAAGAVMTQKAASPLVKGHASLFTATTSEAPYDTSGTGLPDSALLLQLSNLMDMDGVALISFLCAQSQELTISAELGANVVCAAGFTGRSWPSRPEVVWPGQQNAI
eukprot:6335783-Amphidinium_carterae.1